MCVARTLVVLKFGNCRISASFRLCGLPQFERVIGTGVSPVACFAYRLSHGREYRLKHWPHLRQLSDPDHQIPRRFEFLPAGAVEEMLELML